MPILATKRLLLAPSLLTDKAVKQQVEWLNDPENVRYSEQRHLKHNEEFQRIYIRMKGPNFMEIRYGDDLVGTIASDIDKNNSVADVGILIGKKFWGDGLGSEAWTAYCDNLLNNGIRKVEAGMMANNFGMIGVCRKYGMMQEGRRYNHFLVGTELVDMTCFGKSL